MTLGQLLLLYVLAGCGVAVAAYLAADSSAGLERWFRIATSIVFWPMYLPALLVRDVRPDSQPPTKIEACDDLARAIARVDAELDDALRSLDGWAENVLAREQTRLDELRSAWVLQAQRIRDMDRLLGQPESTPTPLGSGAIASERLRMSQDIARQNRLRLREVRDRTLQNLLETLAWVHELVSMIHLAKFTGAPASRAEELVSQIAAAVEGLSALTWQNEAG